MFSLYTACLFFFLGGGGDCGYLVLRTAIVMIIMLAVLKSILSDNGVNDRLMKS